MPFIEGAAAAWYVSAADQSARDTAIRARLQEFHDALLAAGLVEVPDTGAMVNPSALSIPLPNSTTTNTNFFSGSKIYRFDDPLQDTRPIFLKVGFGAATASATVAAALFKITIGQGTDGALNLTGYLFGGREYLLGGGTNFNTSYDAATLKISASMDLGILGILLGENSQQSNGLFCLERVLDEDGEPTNSQIYVQSYNNITSRMSGANSVYRLLSSNTGEVVRENYSNANATPGSPAALIMPSNLPIGVVDGETPVYPHFPFTYRPFPPTLCFMGIEGSAILADIIIPVLRYGVNRNYKNVSNLTPAAAGSGDLLMLTTPD